MNSTCPARPAVAASWSMMPHGTPTKSFSARWASRASSTGGSSTPCRSSSARPVAHSSAALDDSPAPAGTELAMTRSAPPTGWPASRAAHATPAA